MVKAFVTIDTDLEFETGVKGDSQARKQKWSDLASIQASYKRLDKLRAIAQNFTWFVRADNEFESLFNNPFYLFDELKEFWSECLNKRDGLGWHPHIYNQLIPELDDQKVCEYLKRYFPQLKEKFPMITATRMGWGFCTSKVIQTLNSLKIKVDSSGLPGSVKLPLKDWSRTTNKPYNPSNEDYQVPGNLEILELPITSFPLKAPYDAKPVPRYLNLSYDIAQILPLLKKAVSELNEIVLIVHPFELIKHTKPHGLITYSLDNAISVLKALVNECKIQNKIIEFGTL